MTTHLLETLSRELGHDAVEEANIRHPELRACQPEHVQKVVEAVEEVLQFQGWPRTVENAERAYSVLASMGELGKITSQYAPVPSTPEFAPRDDEDEFLRTAPIEEVGDYLRAKYPKGE
jgi:hypothetical protein